MNRHSTDTTRKGTGIRVALAVLACALLLPSVAAARSVYVIDFGFQKIPGTIPVIDSKTKALVGTPLAFSPHPSDIAIAADGKTAYVLDVDPVTLVETLLTMDTQTNQMVGTPIPLGEKKLASAIAITPDGKRAYIPNFSTNDVTVVDLETGQVLKPTIAVGKGPEHVAITPDGSKVYVSNRDGKSVSVIDARTNTVLTTVTVKSEPEGVAVTPDGKRLYVVNLASENVSVIDTDTDKEIAGSPIGVGNVPGEVAISPDGRLAYVSNFSDDTLSVIDTQALQAIGTIPAGNEPEGLAFTPDGKTAYVADLNPAEVTVIDTAANAPLGKPIKAGTLAGRVAIVPDQPPIASFAFPRRIRPGVVTVFDASASRDPDGSVANYAWSFGDGKRLADGGPAPRHAFARPGRFEVTLTATDDEGCSTEFIYTGKTASCNGSGVAAATHTVTVSYPTVAVRCPAAAGSRGCAFKLRAVTKRHRGRPETALARVKVKAGESAKVPLKPSRRFAQRLATARTVLVEETVREGSSSRSAFARLKIVG